MHQKSKSMKWIHWMKKKISSTYDPDIIQLNNKITHGIYIALNCIPNQNCMIVSLFNWHQIYITLKIIPSIKTYNHFNQFHFNLSISSLLVMSELNQRWYYITKGMLNRIYNQQVYHEMLLNDNRIEYRRRRMNLTCF